MSLTKTYYSLQQIAKPSSTAILIHGSIFNQLHQFLQVACVQKKTQPMTKFLDDQCSTNLLTGRYPIYQYTFVLDQHPHSDLQLSLNSWRGILVYQLQYMTSVAQIYSQVDTPYTGLGFMSMSSLGGICPVQRRTYSLISQNYGPNKPSSVINTAQNNLLTDGYLIQWAGVQVCVLIWWGAVCRRGRYVHCDANEQCAF